MGTKRPHHNDSMLASASQRTPNHPSKRRKPNDFALRAAKSASVNQLKSKIRDLTRALQHSDHLPAGVRIEKERALAGYKQDVDTIREDKRKSELIKKYHMVRFFGGSFPTPAQNQLGWDSTVLRTSTFEERQKATRALKKLQRRLDATSPDTPEYHQLEKEVQDAKTDVDYTIYHPLTEKYQSLFPRQENTGGEKAPARKLVTEKPAMWKLVEQCTADGTLEALREGKLTASISAGRKIPASEKPTLKHNNKNTLAGPKSSMGAVPQEQHEESDGGFFEE